MKQFYFYTLFACFFSSQLLAQYETKKQVLINTAKSFELKSRASFSEAVIKAKVKGWPMSYKTGAKTTAYLVGVDAFGQPKYNIAFVNPIPATTVNAHKIWPNGGLGFNLSGNSDSITNKIGIWDEGVPRLTHKEFAGRLVHKDNATRVSEHITHVAGTIMSKGLNPLAKGMSYGIKGAYSYDWNNDEAEMALAAANGLLVSNHSYGIVSGWNYNSDSTRWEFNGRWNEKEDYKFGSYDDATQAFDSIAYNAPNYLIVKAAGNNRNDNGPEVGKPYWRRNEEGKWYNAGNRPDSLSSNNEYDILATDVNAKNILTVGAGAGIAGGYTKKEDVVMTNFSSWGPTDDGRIKPDIVADGLDVFSTLIVNDSSYGNKSGTSMASPGAAGALLLLQELSQQLTKKNIKSATVKALAIQTANEAGNFSGPDYKFGWGLLNMSGAASTLSNALSSNNSSASTDLVFENDLLNNETKTYNIIASGNKPVKATLVWTDVIGTSSTLLDDPTPKLVNDLDLVITKGDKTYYPWSLNPLIPSASATRSNNILDNVEKVELELDSTSLGETYNITVSHKSILARGHQAYSLVVSGSGGSAYCNSTATSNAGTKIDSVSFNNIQLANTTSNQYTDNSKYVITGEPAGLLNIFVKVGSVDATNINRFVKVFIDYNNNGNFEAAETVGTSNVLLNGDKYIAVIQLPSDLVIGKITKLRIVAMETNSSADVKACDNYTIGETQDYTFKITNPTNDLQIGEIVNPIGNICKKDIQYVTVKVINNGSVAQQNIPLNLTIKNGESIILNVNEIFTGKLNGLESMNYTFQKPFTIAANTTYSITASVSLTVDQQKSNDTYSDIVTGIAAAENPIGDAVVCNANLKLTVSNPTSGSSYFWYDNSDFKNIIAVGSSTTASTQQNKVYLSKGYQGLVGPVSNTSLSSTGGYNNFSGNNMKVKTKIPLTINTVKLYTGNAGKIVFELMYMATDTTYYPSLSQFVTINAPASSPSPTPPTGTTSTPFVQNDTGRIYDLNFKLNVAGDYRIVARCDESATLFRNDNIISSPYPIGQTSLFTYTGNSVAGTTYQNYYYFFYNTQISTNDCYSKASEINVKTAEKPSFTLVGDSLVATMASNYQWYMDDVAIGGAINKSHKPTKNAYYKVATFIGDCENVSDNKLILITDIATASTTEIRLKITSDDYVENIIKGNSFYIQFSNIQTQSISLEILNSNGNSLFVKENLNNQNTPQRVIIPSLSTGVYFIKIYANKKVYVQRVLITNK
jgi:hypothetical protein